MVLKVRLRIVLDIELNTQPWELSKGNYNGPIDGLERNVFSSSLIREQKNPEGFPIVYATKMLSLLETPAAVVRIISAERFIKRAP